jgi:hypothetical protein
MADYTNTIQNYKNIERQIITDLKTFKDTMNVSATTKLEQNLQKAITDYSSKVDKTLEEYKSSKIKDDLPEKEYNRRVNELQAFKQSYIKLHIEYESLINNKYGYVRPQLS